LYGLKEKFSHKKGKIKRLALLMKHKKPQISTYQSNKGKDKGALTHHPPPPPLPYDSNKLKGINLRNLINKQKEMNLY
jgi:hypothetical protein